MKPHRTQLRDFVWLSAFLGCLVALLASCSWFIGHAARRSDGPALRIIDPQSPRSALRNVVPPAALPLPPRVPAGFVQCGQTDDGFGRWFAANCSGPRIQDTYLLVEHPTGRRAEMFVRKVPVLGDIPPGHTWCSGSEITQFWAAVCPADERDYLDVTIIGRWFSNVYGDIEPADGNWLVDLDDILFVLGAIRQTVHDPEIDERADIWPCDQTDSDGDLVDVDDLVAVMEAFKGNPRCP